MGEDRELLGPREHAGVPDNTPVLLLLVMMMRELQAVYSECGDDGSRGKEDQSSPHPVHPQRNFGDHE